MGWLVKCGNKPIKAAIKGKVAPVVFKRKKDAQKYISSRHAYGPKFAHDGPNVKYSLGEQVGKSPETENDYHFYPWNTR